MVRRLRKISRKFGITAPRVAIRTEKPWYWRWVIALVVVALTVAVGAWMYDAGQRLSGFDREQMARKLSAANAELDADRKELERLRAIANASDSRIAIERTAQQRLAQQLRALEDENSNLREELAIFERMLSSDPRSAPAISVNRFKVMPDVLPGEYRYRLLLISSGSQRDREFKGHLQLVLSLTDQGKSAIMRLPQEGGVGGSGFGLSFKYFRRVEGTFRIAPSARLEQVQVRVIEDGSNQVRATQILTLG